MGKARRVISRKKLEKKIKPGTRIGRKKTATATTTIKTQIEAATRQRRSRWSRWRGRRRFAWQPDECMADLIDRFNPKTIWPQRAERKKIEKIARLLPRERALIGGSKKGRHGETDTSPVLPSHQSDGRARTKRSTAVVVSRRSDWWTVKTRERGVGWRSTILDWRPIERRRRRGGCRCAVGAGCWW